MASLPTGSDKLLEIRTAYIDLIIKYKGKPAVCTWESGAASSSLLVSGIDIEKIGVPAQSIAEKYADHKGIADHKINVLPLFFEQTDYVVTIQSKNSESLQFRSNNSLVEGSLSYVKDDDPTLLNGVINYGSSVGFSDLTVIANGKQVLSVRVEVYPTKLSYKDDYQEMMADINNMVSESILDFMKKTYQVFVPDHKRNDVPAVFFTILQSIYDKYLRAANRILAVPHHKLITEHEVMPHYKAARTDARSEKWLRKHPEYVKRCDGRILAEKVLAVNKQITYDTQENRLVKFMLQSTVRRIEDFTRRYQNSTLKPDKNIITGAARMSRELKRLLSTTFLSEVSERNAAKSMSLVFGMAPGYRELYKYYLMLQNGIAVGGDIFHMSVRDTAQLYEYWCFIKLYDILRNRYTLKSPDIIKVDRKGVTVDLVKGKDSNVVFLNPQNGELIKLTYNQSESKTQTVSQRPDNILELEKKGSSVSYKYVFDAKYRIEMNPDSKYYPDDKPGPKVDDINTMHRYRDSIVYANPSSRFTFEKTMFGAYILFPYALEKEYTEHKFYKSIEAVNIGGLPFLPSAMSLVTELLDELVTDSPEAAFERATLPVGIEERLRAVDWSRRDVLIGLVPDDAHLELYTDNLMYFTPRFDIGHLPVRYVALYEKGKGISRYGEVVSWRRAARETLPGFELSHRAHRRLVKKEPYNVFEVLKWHILATPISIAEYGPSPIAYTNFFLLSNSSSYSELFLKNEDEYAMMGEVDDSRIEMVQFHQNYSYEDFIMGYRPDGADFKLTDGIFYRFCQTAANHPDKEYFFIIDEINRGNMSKIFGELLMLIEKGYRGTKCTLAYSGMPFSVPENLYIIGMMNTADRSLAMIDYALRRRFSFFEMEPGFNSEGFTNYQKAFANETFDALIDQVKILNKEITEDKSLGRGFQIGHSYFCSREPDGCTDEWMRSVVEFDILPMLSEYWFDEPTKLQRWEKNLRGVFDDQG